MKPELVPVLLADLALIIALAQVLGRAARRCGQPPVVGEILAGVLMGPTLLDGAIARTLFPVEVRPSLSVLANVGVAVFMCLVGLEVDHRILRGRGRLVTAVSLSSIMVPFALGAVLALYLVDGHSTAHRVGFVLFFGAAMSVTAFPVLARILADRDMIRTPLGGLALTCAAVDDVLAWTALAVVVSIISPESSWHVVLVVPYCAVMLWVVRPLLRRATGLAVVLPGLLVSAAVTEWLGLHFIFGAFLFGVVLPRSVRDQVVERAGPVCSVLLLPVFFTVAGLAVDLSSVDASALGELGLILLVAVGGKFAGAFVAARVNGLGTRESAVLGSLMNTRGLTELVILAVGLELGVLDSGLYSLMVVMALLTTAMTGPLLQMCNAAIPSRKG